MSTKSKKSPRSQTLNKTNQSDPLSLTKDEVKNSQPLIPSSHPQKNQFWLLIGLLIGLIAFILSPQTNDRISALSTKFNSKYDDPNAPHVRVTIARAAMDSEPNATVFGKRFINQRLFSELVYEKKGRFFDPSSAIQIKTWGQLTRWANSADAKKLGGDSPFLYFDPGEKKSSLVSMFLGNKASQDEASQDYDALWVRSGDGGVPFIWPPLKIGHKVVRKDMAMPRGKDYPITIETVNISPKVFYVHNFMSDEEVDALVAFAQDPANPYALRPSTTGHKSWTEGGEKNTNSRRTSLNSFDVSSPTSNLVKNRAFELLKIDPYFDGQADGIQVLRYEKAQAYIPHTDYFSYTTSADHNWDPREGGTNRFATVFLHLSDVEDGGETVFPRVDRPSDMLQNTTSESFQQAMENSGIEPDSWEHTMVKQCRTQFSVKPHKGDALLFYNQGPDGTLDERSFHGGCPVLGGTKWAGNVWVWNGCRYGICKNLPKQKNE